MRNLFTYFRGLIPLIALLFMLPAMMWGAEVTATLTGASMVKSGSPSTSYADYEKGVTDNQDYEWTGRWCYQKSGSEYLQMVQIKAPENSVTSRLNVPTYQGNIKSIKVITTNTNATASNGTKQTGTLYITKDWTKTNYSKNSNVVASGSLGDGTITFDLSQGTYSGDGLYIVSSAAIRIWSVVVVYTTSGDNPSTPTALSVPTDLQSSNVTTTGATLSWTAVANASSYTVRIGETEYTDVNTNSYSATGLTAGTQYTWSVKAVGDGTNYSTSDYAENKTFTTEAEQGGGDDTPTYTFDFTVNNFNLPTSALKNREGSYTYDGKTIKLYGDASNGFKFSTNYLIMGKLGAYLTLPAFDFAVEKIVVVGNSGASTSVVQNIFVGESAVSTATTGAAGTNTYAIAENHQSAGNIYTLKVTSSHNTQITYVKIYRAAPKVSKVTLNTNGGTINSGNITEYTEGTGATLPTDVTKTGFSFDGWFDNSDFTGSAITAISASDKGDKEFWAKWTSLATEAYTVTFDGNGKGTPAENSLKEVSAGAGVTLPDCEANEGWVFKGWATTADATTANAGVTGDIYHPTSDNTPLYAFYKVKPATPSFDPVAGAIDKGDGVSISCTTDGVSIYYTLDGTTPTSESSAYSEVITINEAKTIKAIAILDGESSDVATAEYTIATHTARFSINGNIDESKNSTVAKGEAITFPANPADLDDFKFFGWTKTQNYSDAKDAPSDLCNSATMGTEDITFYAVYATASGSTSEPESMNLSFSLGTTMPTGWTTDADGGASGYIRLKDGQYAQVDVVEASIIPEDKILASDNMSVVVSVGTYGSWSGTTKSVKIIISLLDKEENVLSSNNATFSSLSNSESAEKDAISVSKPSDPSKIKYLRVTAADHTGGSEIRLKYVKPTYSITDDITYSDYTTKVKAVDHIKVTTAPTKVLYKVGETIDESGIEVTAYFDAEGTDSRVLSAGYTITPDAALTTSDKTITVTLNADNTKTATTPIDVVALDKIVATGAKDTYFETQDFDRTGLVVTATWGTEEGKKIEEDVTADVTITGDKNLQHTANSVQISYTHEGTTKTFDYAITVTQSNEKELTRLTMSNGFKPFITSKNLVAYYIQGSEVPSIIETSIVVSPYATESVVGNSIIVTAQDGTEATYTVTTTEVAPMMTSTNAATTFDGTETAWIKSGYGWSADKGWKISKNLDSKDLTDESRIIEGRNRLYFYIGPALEFKLINGLIGTNRDVIVTVNGVVQSDLNKIIANSKDNGPSVMTLTGLSNQTNNVICVESNNNGGDGGFSAYELTIAPRYTVSFKYTDGTEAHEDICQETYNANITLPDLTVADGKLFKGWSTSAEPTSADAGAAGATYKPTANTPLYAYIVDVYAVTLAATEHGSFIVKNGATTITSGDKIELGTTLTIECTNDEHYHVASVTYNDTEIPLTDNKYSFDVPAEAVTVAVTFEEDEKFEVSWMVNGFEAKKENLYADVPVSAPAVSAQGNKEFMGWVESPIAEATDTKPDMVDVSNLTVNEPKTFYAVFATKSGTSSTEEFSMSATSITQNGITIAAAKAKGNSDPAYTSNELRIYASNTITISSDDYITAFSLTFHKQGSKDYIDVLTANVGEYVSGGKSTSGEDNKVDTWTGSSKSITLTAGNSGQRVFVSASVTVGSTVYSDYCTSITSCDITLTNPTTEGAYGFSTFCGSANYTVVGANAYKASVVSGELVLTKLEGIIPAGNSKFENGVVIAGTPGETATIRYTSEEADADMSGNQLLGTLDVTPAADLKGNATYLMVFSKSMGGFVSYKGEDVPAYKACLPYSSDNAGAPMRMVFGRDNLPTNNVNVNVNDNHGTKVMIDGRLYILRDGKTYDSFGRLVK